MSEGSLKNVRFGIYRRGGETWIVVELPTNHEYMLGANARVPFEVAAWTVSMWAPFVRLEAEYVRPEQS